ncbi:hypothetical protein KQX54_017327 [Cotesia glomerata]|uniref:Transmembrane protein n=1 Tax=Cotesia glomerata TaxID=32391 RepID=A0AAV7ICK4_COTGL|nr:hypothetical protein KQX54_017327 [Cotesia glomerata]
MKIDSKPWRLSTDRSIRRDRCLRTTEVQKNNNLPVSLVVYYNFALLFWFVRSVLLVSIKHGPNLRSDTRESTEYRDDRSIGDGVDSQLVRSRLGILSFSWLIVSLVRLAKLLSIPFLYCTNHQQT